MTKDTYGLRAKSRSGPKVKITRGRSPKTFDKIKDMHTWIVSYREKNSQMSPTRREIGEAFGGMSTSVVTYFLRVMVEQKLIKPLPIGISRAIFPIPQKESVNEQPTA